MAKCHICGNDTDWLGQSTCRICGRYTCSGCLKGGACSICNEKLK